MSEKTIRVGVIGTGKIGKNHIKKYQEIDGAEIVAVCDLDEAEAKRVAGEYGIADVYTDYHALLERDDIDAVDVCLHNQLHRPVSVDAMEAGKDVYCEKPIAATYADGKAMLDAAERTGRKLHIQVNTIFNPATMAAKQAIDRGELGEVYHGRAFVNLRRSRPFVDGKNTAQFVQKATAGGGALIDWGIYAISQILYLMGNPRPVRITGQTYTKVPMDEARRAESGWDVEEMGAGFVHFENGATLDVLAAWALNVNAPVPPMVAGSHGGIMLPPMPGGKDVKPRFFSAVDDPWTERDLDPDALVEQWQRQGLGDAYTNSQSHWVRVLQGRVEREPAAEVALNMIMIAEGIYRSVEAEREIRAEEIESAAQPA